MSLIKTAIGWFGRILGGAPARTVDLDAMSLHDWADLPAYHPRVDRAEPAAPC